MCTDKILLLLRRQFQYFVNEFNGDNVDNDGDKINSMRYVIGRRYWTYMNNNNEQCIAFIHRKTNALTEIFRKLDKSQWKRCVSYTHLWWTKSIELWTLWCLPISAFISNVRFLLLIIWCVFFVNLFCFCESIDLSMMSQNSLFSFSFFYIFLSMKLL